MKRRHIILLAILLGLLAQGVGCRAKDGGVPALPDPVAGSSIQRAAARTDDAKVAVESVLPQTDGRARIVLEGVVETLKRAGADLLEAAQQYAAERIASRHVVEAEHAKVVAAEAKYVELRQDPWVKAALWLRAAIYTVSITLCIWLIVFIGLCIGGLLVPGSFGATLQVVGRVVGGPLVWFVTIIDNVFWRRIQGAAVHAT
jgi:hypothetical protein